MAGSLELGPISRALMRNKLGVVLIAFDVFFTERERTSPGRFAE